MRIRTTLLVCAAVAISGWLPVPLPSGILKRIAPDGVELSATSVSVRWAPGTIVLKDFRLAKVGASGSEESLAILDQLQLHLDLLPGVGFLTIRGMIINGGEVHSDKVAELLNERRLADKTTANLTPPPAFKLELNQLRCTAPVGDSHTSFLIASAKGQARGRNLKLHGEIVSDFGLHAIAWLSLGPEDWGFDLFCPRAELGGFDFLPADLRAESCQLALHLAPNSKVIDFNLENVELKLAEPPLSFVLKQMRVAGSLSNGIIMNANGVFEGTPIHLSGWLHRDQQGRLAAVVGGNANAIVLDKKRTDWIRRLDPGTAEVFEALELRGMAPASFAWNWHTGAGVGDWLVHSSLTNSSLTYRGFLEDDGDQPSFPYPLEGLNGDFIVAGPRFLFDVTGNMGDAAVTGSGTVKLTGGTPLIGIELEVEQLPIDARIRHALGGTPAAAAVWRDLGGPQGGTANLNLSLARHPHDESLRLQLDGVIHGTIVRPSFLPIELEADGLQLEWRPGHARFSGPVRALGGIFHLNGEAQAVYNSDLPALQVSAVSTAGLAPSATERMILESFLNLPPGASSFTTTGNANWQLQLRRPGRSEQTKLLMTIASSNVNLSWDPIGIQWEEIKGQITLAHTGKRSLITAPRLAANCSGGRTVVSTIINIGSNPEDSSAVVKASEFGLNPTSVNFARAIANLDPSPDLELHWTGQLDLVAEFSPLAAERNRGRIRLGPMQLRNSRMLPDELVEVHGDIRLRNGGLFAGELDLHSTAGDLHLSEFELQGAQTDTSASKIKTVINSPGGIEISDRFAELISPNAWAAFERIGLSGRIGADNLLLEISPLEGPTTKFKLDGGVLLRDIRLQAAPGINNGHANLEVHKFSWSGPLGFGGELELSAGAAELAGLHLSDANGNLSFRQDEIVVNDFDGVFLGGQLSTSAPALDNPRDQTTRPGKIRLGLVPEAPIELRLYLRNGKLSNIRDSFGMGGNLAGQIDFDLDVRATSPSPLDYSGDIDLRIRDGVLGAVPVLSEMWKVAGVQAPIFDSGQFLVHANSTANRGRLRIEKFTLSHDLLQVTGKGWIGLDSYLNVKATVRSALIPVLGWGFPILTDLFFDPLFEQDVIGPIDNPRIAQRVLNKLSAADKIHIPFSLWVPKIERTDWRRSPAFPPANSGANQVSRK